MTFIGLKTGERAQRGAYFLISLKTGDVLELTIYGGGPAGAGVRRCFDSTASEPARRPWAARLQAKRPGNAAVTGLALRGAAS